MVKPAKTPNTELMIIRNENEQHIIRIMQCYIQYTLAKIIPVTHQN